MSFAVDNAENQLVCSTMNQQLYFIDIQHIEQQAQVYNSYKLTILLWKYVTLYFIFQTHKKR